MQVDWEELARQINIIDRHSTSEFQADGFSSADGHKAIEVNFRRRLFNPILLNNNILSVIWKYSLTTIAILINDQGDYQ